MKIRAITIGQRIPYLIDDKVLETSLEESLQKFSKFNESLVSKFNQMDIEVQTKRLCSQPILSYDEQVFDQNLNNALDSIHGQLTLIEELITKYGIDYFASCAVLADLQMAKYGIYESLFLKEVPQFIKRKEKIFSSLHVASNDNGINLSALKSGAMIIKELSDPDPFNNLRFCVSTNVKPNTPFFPAAYHLSKKPSFSIALQMADEVVEVFEESKSFEKLQIALRARFEEIYQEIVPICETVSKEHELLFQGVDMSPAPYPKLKESIGTAIENLNFEYFGAPGSLIAVAMIKNAIPYKEKTIGFNGFMPPVLEDYSIAKRLSESQFNLDTLLLYSTMCGTGLDCVPLPGDVTVKELFYILLDLCTISLRLKKPLTARLMPIPGKSAGDDVKFDFEYFAPSKVMKIRRLTKEIDKDLFGSKQKSFKFV
ncbi:MAG: DUF711 family protein [Promethearchaeota archaeon]|nr:MAG: DUF711 family protein [Candidatus Lokiarchaeota archaeon]